MSTRGRTLRLATRGSELALRQAAIVRDLLATRRLEVELVEVETTGDQLRDELIHRLGTTGAFVRSLDEKVIDGELDAAVHSMKDMPTDQPPELVVAGIPERAAAGDVLVTPDGTDLADLPSGAVIGTSSLRRRAQLLARRPDLEVEGLRGNVDTRVEKLLAPSLQREHERRIEAAEGEDDSDNDEDEEFDQSVEEWFDGLAEVERRALEREVDTEYDAICLAEAGLARSGLLHHLESQRLDPTEFVPAPGQGAIAVTALDGEVAETVHAAVDHPPTRVETTVERTVLSELGGGCVAPLGVHARLQGEVVTAAARVLSQDGTEEVAGERELPVERHAEAAVEFAADLAEEGAKRLVEQAARESADGAKRE
ncbi:hydroxymethylbilane synthase [Salinirussus salinus]|jgi:hydroxymethylbilane synthase|uniref:hydroxymethylbilane synthase n=1 Tax=Salinirussus salinus TaxID=1198300 RepID=UPI001359039B|nr:hydroxymethylbilane synthase [Salinirussus salinus]